MLMEIALSWQSNNRARQADEVFKRCGPQFPPTCEDMIGPSGEQNVSKIVSTKEVTFVKMIVRTVLVSDKVKIFSSLYLIKNEMHTD